VECADLAAAKAAIDDLQGQGARLIKVPVGQGPTFDATTLAGIVAHAHAAGLKVSTHATSDAGAAQAATAGADILAHTPTATMSAATVQAWSAVARPISRSPSTTPNVVCAVATKAKLAVADSVPYP
jgi:imidazolonepropionase-like amidohydrolase